MPLAHQLGGPLRRCFAHHWTNQQLIRALVQLRQRRDGLERLLVNAIEFLHLLQILKPSLVQRDVVLDLAVRLLYFLDVHAVQPGRKLLNVFQHFDDLRVLLLRNLTRNEDPEMTDVRMNQSHDRLAVGFDLFGARVDIADPIERLLRRRDVVAHRRKDDDRLLDRLQIEIASRTQPRFALRQLVADEEIVDYPADLLFVHQVVAAPPALELEKALGLDVDVVEQVVILVEDRVGWIQIFEVLDEIGAIELAAAQVAREQRQP